MLIKSLEWTGAKGPPLDFECEDQCSASASATFPPPIPRCWELSNKAGSEKFFCQGPGSKYVRLYGHSDSFATAQLCHGSAKAALANALTNEWVWVPVKSCLQKQAMGQRWPVGRSSSTPTVERRIWPLVLVRDSLFTIAAGPWPLLLFCLPNCMQVHLVGTT